MNEITRDTLMAFLDGTLDPSSRAEVDAWLKAHPDAALDLLQLQRQSDAIHALYGPVASEPVPERLSPQHIARVQSRRRRQVVTQAAMLVGTLAVGISVGWLLRPLDSPALYNRLIADAVSAHTVYVAENRHAVEVDGNEAGHLASWLSNRLSTDLAMPDLSDDGFVFLGGRLLPAPAIPGGRAAQLMYEHVSGGRLTLYVTPAAGVDGPQAEWVRLGDDNALFWSNDQITCTIVGAQPVESIEALAQTVFAQLNPATTTPRYREL